MASNSDIPLFTEREIPKLLDLALSEVSQGLIKHSHYLLYFLTQIPTSVYEKIRDKVIPETYLSPTADNEFQMKRIMPEGFNLTQCRFAEVWIRILEKSSVVDKVALLMYNTTSQKLTPLGNTKEFDLPPNFISCVNNPKEKFIVNGHKFEFSPRKHPTMFLATIADEPTVKFIPTITQKDVDEIMSDRQKVREKLEALVKFPSDLKEQRKKLPYHLVVNSFEMNSIGDMLYIVAYNTNVERHTIVYTAWIVLKDIMLLDAFYHDTELFKLWYT